MVFFFYPINVCFFLHQEELFEFWDNGPFLFSCLQFSKLKKAPKNIILIVTSKQNLKNYM